MPPEIETERLRLRRWLPVDHAPFARICGDPEVMRHIGDGSVRTAEEASRAIKRFEEEWARHGFGLFAVEAKESGTFIGFTGLSSPEFLPEVLPAVEIGWRLARPSWGQGYASEAAARALAFGTRDLGLTDIVSICQTANGASVRIMEKLGLVFDRGTVDPTCGREVQVYRLPKSAAS